MAKLCLGCMQPKECSPVCEHCGYDERKENLMHQLPVGTLLQNQYLIGRVLGQGGFGITYLGWDQHLSAPVAIKEYFPSGVVQRHTQMGSQVYLANGEAPELFRKHSARFLKEARTLAQLTDIPEIVQIRNFFSQNDTAYIVMEYVQGITLKDHLKKLGRPMTEAEALAIMEPVLRALQKVHDHGLIHRDISPDNIMLPKDGGIKLIDFGTVRYVDDSGKSKSTEAVLKPGFAPMEQYNTHGNLGTWTDVYAICATFHYLLTGKVPAEVTERMEHSDTLPMLRNGKTLSAHILQALECGMKLRISDRIQTISELYQKLYAPSGRVPVMQRKKSAPKKPRLFIGICAAILAVAISSFVLFSEKEIDSPAPDSTATVQNKPQKTTDITEDLLSDPESVYQQALVWAENNDFGRAAVTMAQLDGYKDSRALAFTYWSKVPNRKTVSFYDYYDEANGRYVEMIHAIRNNGTVAADATFSDSLSGDALSHYATASYQEIVSIHGVIGLRFDGTLALPDGESKYQPLKSWTNLKAISVYESPEESANAFLCVGLKTDGTVVCSGSPGLDTSALRKWTDIQAVDCGENMIVGLTADGSVVYAGADPTLKNTLKNWTGICSVSISGNQILGLRSNGSVVTTGAANPWIGEEIIKLADGSCGITVGGTPISDDTAISDWRNIVDVANGSWQSVGLTADGTLVFTADGYEFYANAKNWDKLLLPDQVVADPQVQYALAQELEAANRDLEAAITYGKLGTYLDSRERSFQLWHKHISPKTISAGSGCTAMIRTDGKVLSPVIRDNRQYGVSSWKDIQSISCGYSQTVGLKSDGTVVSINGTGIDNRWTDLISIDAATGVTMGLKRDGTVLSAGPQQSDVSDWADIVAISASSHAVGLKADGTVVAAGSNRNGQCEVSKWENIVAISSASYNSTGFTVGLKLDGTVVTAGVLLYGQPDVSGWTDIIAVDTGVYEDRAFVAGLKADGTVVASGLTEGELSSIADWTDIVSISASNSYLLGLKKDGTMVSVGSSSKGETRVSHLSDIQIPSP